MDYRALNRITTKNNYPLLRIDDLLANLSGAKFFSSLDFDLWIPSVGVRRFRSTQNSIGTLTLVCMHIRCCQWVLQMLLLFSRQQ
jgi:hypothetical protein